MKKQDYSRKNISHFGSFESLIEKKRDLWNDNNKELISRIENGLNQKPSPAVELLLEHDKFMGKRVLDLGSELGKNAIPLLKRNCKVTLMDISDKAIAYSMKKI